MGGKFSKLGNPLGLAINSIVHYNGETLMGASGRYVLRWDESRDFNFKTADTILLNRKHEDMNPQIVERLPAGYAKLEVNENNELLALSRDDIKSRPFRWDDNRTIEIDRRYVYLVEGDSRQKIFSFYGRHKKQLLKPPNNKLLFINGGELVLMNPEDLIAGFDI